MSNLIFDAYILPRQFEAAIRWNNDIFVFCLPKNVYKHGGTAHYEDSFFGSVLELSKKNSPKKLDNRTFDKKSQKSSIIELSRNTTGESLAENQGVYE